MDHNLEIALREGGGEQILVPVKGVCFRISHLVSVTICESSTT